MNIYEQLNKINDTESLSEKYNVKNLKELKKLKESISSIKIPAPWNKYLEVDDYTPEEGEYIVGDKIGEYTLVAYLAPKSDYEDIIDEWPMLFKNSESYIVGTISHDRVYSYDVEDFGLEESLKEDTHNSSKSTKDCVEAAKQIIADLESKGFVNSDIAAIGTMIKETIDSRYPEYVPPMDRLRKKFPDLNIWLKFHNKTTNKNAEHEVNCSAFLFLVD